ncbi:hypothetical protein COUCH_02215 [Couchioplanes caeruleus]|uniref:hypothetical protein n=1 Tax=Couchioplanes caeruleus TaxID=56438 RepID=UPI0020C0B13C|nr:hypothetical protein [Couchioplanes caeruleus]UQU65186.1 hypothetical protein COUCH_02215 [Couchioplanes caeruleus]
MFRKSIMAATLALAVSLSAVAFGGAPASAATPVSKTDLQIVRAALVKYGVPPTSQNSLLSAFARGERWDSESGAAPVSTEVDQVGGAERTIYRYLDGSVNVSTVEIPTEVSPEVSAMGISGCQSYSVTGAKAWRNCKVGWDAATWSVSFTAAYKYYLGPSYGCYIDSIGGLAHGGVGSFSNDKLEYITRSANGYTGQCIAQGSYKRSYEPVGSETVGVKLNLTAEHGGGWTSKVSA